VGVIGIGIVTFVHLRAGDDPYAPETPSVSFTMLMGVGTNISIFALFV